MKPILLVYECDLSLNTGYSINEREFVKGLLSTHEQSVSVIAPKPKFPAVFEDNRIDYVYDHNHHNPIKYIIHLIHVLYRIFGCRRAGKAEAVVFRIGVVPLIPIVVSALRIPIIFKTLSGYSLFSREDRRLSFRALSLIARPLFSWAVRSARFIDTPSYAFADWFVEVTGVDRGRIKIIPNGVNCNKFKPSPCDKMDEFEDWSRFDRIVGYVGAVDRIRNLDNLVAAFSTIKSSHELGLVIVGKGEGIDALKIQAMNLGLSDRILLPGFLPYREIPTLINRFSVAVDLTYLPVTLGAKVELTSFSQKIPQYLACDVPVIAYRTRETEFLDEERLGVTVRPNDLDGLQVALGSLLNDWPRCGDPRLRKFAERSLSYDYLASLRMRYWQDCLNSCVN